MRFFYAPEIADPRHELGEDEARHVVRVLRSEVGDEFHLTNGKGSLFLGRIVELTKRSCTLETELIRTDDRRVPALTLVVAPTKSTERFEWMLEKAAEIGVERIQPIWTSRSERRIEKRDRWMRVLVSALKQSRQTWVPELSAACNWEDWLEEAASSEAKGYIAHCIAPMKHFAEELTPGVPAWIAIGPEGDFTENEVEAARSAGGIEVGLGENRLRTETAGLVAVHTFDLAQRLRG
jgi:16S rRNA (uracil1498-N3)-methyltransferase